MKQIIIFISITIHFLSVSGKNGMGNKHGAPADSIILRDTIPTVKELEEVIVTAQEGDRLTSSSMIDRDAMNHLQPSSFTDLLELLPGNISHDPELGKVNSISLRETGNLGASGTKVDNDDYAISSLGTLFLVDGAPINGDSNLQSIGIAADQTSDSRNTTNRGVDMRTISTDNIKSVEIIRGIPSAEYGNLTSGVVRIKRISSATPFTARFKADGYSKLFSAGKGFSLTDENPIILNTDINYLDAKSDPRNSLENYKRLTGSLRLTYRKSTDDYEINFSAAGDYTGSFDNSKIDKDLTLLKIDDYKSSYNRINLTSEFTLLISKPYFFNDFNANISAGYQIDNLERRKQVAPQRASVAPTTLSPGEHPGQYLLGEYIAEYKCEGRPLNLFLKGRASGFRSTGSVSCDYKVGFEWTLSKNYGKGQIYELTKPLSASWGSRPRAFSDIPALHIFSIFAEENAKYTLGPSSLSLQAGVRGIMIPSTDSGYYLSNRPYFDPRVNIGWDYRINIISGNPLMLSITAGLGLTTRMPTADYLYPQQNYADIIQLNYYDVENPRDNSIVSLMTYINDAVNYELRPARNLKWEIRPSVVWNGFRISVTYFQEKMTDGFRYSYVYAPYTYKKYDASSISSYDSPNINLDNTPFSVEKILKGYRKATNGTRIEKRGVEWQLATPRWKALKTSLSITGAWLHTTYSNSEMLYSSVNDVVEGIAVSDRYIGLYDYFDGRINDRISSNFMFDTQIPKWGLIFTTSFQCVWNVSTSRIPINGVPPYYLDAADGELHAFGEDYETNSMLSYLIKTYNDASFETVKIPFEGYINLKATKKIGKSLRIALFINRILDILPDYYSNGLLVRRSSSPYFGMELNVSI